MARVRAVSTLRIDANGPFDLHAALGTLAAHAIDGLHRYDADSAELTRWVEVSGEPHLVTVRLDTGGVTVATATRDESTNVALTARVNRWFDLDADLDRVNDHLGADPVFAAQVQSRPGIRIVRFDAPFEATVLTVLGQQVSLAAGRLFGARLVAAYGIGPPPGCSGLGLSRFPTPAALAAVPADELRATVGLTGSRARTVQEVAELFANSGDTDSLPSRADLHAVHGIGPWTLDYLALRASPDTDAFPAADAVLRRTLAALDPRVDAARVASWSPYRSYAASRIWARIQ